MRRDEREVRDRLDALERGRATVGAVSSLSGAIDSRITGVSGTMDAEFVSLSGTINARFATLSGSDNAALSGTINARFISVSGTIDARFTSLSGTVNSAIVSLSGTIDSAIAVRQPLDADLTAIAALSSNGLVERTGAGTAAIRALGTAAGTSVPTLADSDARYLGINSGSAIETMRYIQIPGFQAGNGTTSGKSLASIANQLYYYGKAPRNWSSGTLVGAGFRCTAAGSGFTWAELAICTGSFVRGGAPTIWAVGYVDVITKLTGTTTQYVEVPVMKPGGIIAGEDIWLLWGKLSTGSPSIQCSTLNENIIIGVNCLMTGAWQPSTFVNTDTFVTVPTSPTTPLHWTVMYYP